MSVEVALVQTNYLQSIKMIKGRAIVAGVNIPFTKCLFLFILPLLLTLSPMSERDVIRTVSVYL